MVTAMIWCAAYCAQCGVTVALGPIEKSNEHFVTASARSFLAGVIVLATLATLYVNGVGA